MSRQGNPARGSLVAILGGVLFANLVGGGTGCSDPQSETLCPRIAYIPAAIFFFDDYRALRGDSEASLEICIDDIGCTTMLVRPDEQHLDRVGCPVSAADPARVPCSFDAGGALRVGLELGDIEPRTQTHGYAIRLEQAGVETTATGTITVEARHPDGPDCGTQLIGEVRVDAATLAQVHSG
jgi:hypothetical protein